MLGIPLHTKRAEAYPALKIPKGASSVWGNCLFKNLLFLFLKALCPKDLGETQLRKLSKN
jgi:hypothetical protein